MNGRFICRDAESDERKLLIKNQFRFDHMLKAYVSRSWADAVKLRNHFVGDAFEKYHAVTFEEYSKPYIESRDLIRDHYEDQIYKFNDLDEDQREGIYFSATRNHSYLAFEAGVGKTATAIGISQICYSPHRPSLLIAPPNLISNWINEIKEWYPKASYLSVTSSKEINDLSDNDADIIICADSLFLKDKVFDISLVYETVKKCKYTLIIIDEAHRFVNLKAARTEELFGNDVGNGIAHRSRKVVLLSGSHMTRGPINLYAPVKALAWNLINYCNLPSYGVRFCNGYEKRFGSKKVWDFSGSSREDELHKRLYGKFILQKSLKLKAKRIERVITLDHKGLNPTVKRLEDTILKKQKIEDLIGSNELGDIAAYRKWIAEDKVDACKSYIEDQIEDSNESFVLFAIHHSTIDMLLEVFKKYKPKEISGRIKMKDRDKVEANFQSGKLKLIVWQIETAYGRNAQKNCSRCFFVESPWSPDKIDQPINRFYRRGQNKNVIADHLVLANTLDEYVLKRCIDKKETIKKVSNTERE